MKLFAKALYKKANVMGADIALNSEHLLTF